MVRTNTPEAKNHLAVLLRDDVGQIRLMLQHRVVELHQEVVPMLNCSNTRFYQPYPDRSPRPLRIREGFVGSKDRLFGLFGA